MKKLKKLLAVIMIIALMIPCTAMAATNSAGNTKTKISKATITVKSVTYTGKTQSPKVTVKYGKKTLNAGTDYTVSKVSKKAAGSYTVTITGKGSYTGSVKKTFTIKKAASKVATKAPATLKASTLKKKAKSYAVTVTGKGKVTYSVKVSGKNAKKSYVSVKNGKITLKKGTKAGTYKVTVKVAKTANYKATSKTITIKVK